MNNKLNSPAYSIIFLSYDEPNAENNWLALKNRFPSAKRVHGVEGILNAHKLCAEKSDTEMFFLVDGDNEVLDSFDFSFSAPAQDSDAIHVWRCKNPVNGLVYGYGAIKLYPKAILENATLRVDLATSAAKKYKIMPQTASITHFNTSAFNTWRSAFRECVKLSSECIANQQNKETFARLETWCTVGKEQKFGAWSLAGANSGKAYGASHKNDSAALAKINDFAWLRNQYESLHGKQPAISI